MLTDTPAKARRFQIELPAVTYKALSESAAAECRTPRQQAAWLIEQALRAQATARTDKAAASPDWLPEHPS